MDDVSRVVAMLDAGGAPSLADLERAAAALHGCPRPRSLPEAVTRWRIAVRLERVAREGDAAVA